MEGALKAAEGRLENGVASQQVAALGAARAHAEAAEFRAEAAGLAGELQAAKAALGEAKARLAVASEKESFSSETILSLQRKLEDAEVRKPKFEMRLVVPIGKMGCRQGYIELDLDPLLLSNCLHLPGKGNSGKCRQLV